MNDYQKYLFDLQGYLILEGALDPSEVAELNRLLDEQKLPEPGLVSSEARFGGSGAGLHGEDAGFLEWGNPFCDLLDHPRIMPLLKVILGDGFRVDHFYGIYMRAGTERLRLHGGSTPYDPPEYYHFRNGRMFNGLTVVSWNLTDSGGELGGFVGVPGSHKSNYPCPAEVKEAHEKAECVVCPEVRAGSVVIFTEALTHGTAAWTGEHQRRSLLFKYSPAQQSWGRAAQMPSRVELTPRQKLLFEPPYFARRASLFDADAVPDY